MSKDRNKHSRMENERSASYAILADSREYIGSYAPYIAVAEEMLKEKKNIKVLNIGSATGILEFLMLQRFNAVNIVSIDNSTSFQRRFLEKNQQYLDNGSIKYFLGKIQDYSFDDNFDLIISRDVNHHLELKDVRAYIRKAYNSLSPDGLLIIEDLRKDATPKGVMSFVELVYQIPEYKDDIDNLYYKILGLIESFLVSYTYERIKNIVERLGIPFNSEISETRYKLTIKK